MSGGNDSLEEYLGPYERWNYEHGKRYAFPAIREPEEFNYLTALVQIPTNDNIAERVLVQLRSSDPASRRALLPIIWSAQGFNPSFLPVMLDNTQASPDRKSYSNFQGEELNSLLKGFAETSLQDIWKELEGQQEGARARFRVNFPVPDKTVDPAYPADPLDNWEPAQGQLERPKAIIAVIDDGIPFAHENFLGSDGDSTRIEYCWLQSAEIANEQRTVPFGREFDRSQINNLIDKYGHDEDLLYEAAGAGSHEEGTGTTINRRASHGAHILDLAAGNGVGHSDSMSDDIRIIAVQLPDTIAWDTSGFGKDMFMLSAFHYILERAKHIAEKSRPEATTGQEEKAIPLVINFSYGFSGGPHDGYKENGGLELETAINELIDARKKLGPTKLIMPAGNTFEGRLHGEIQQGALNTPGASSEISWRLQPSDRTSNYLEIWFSREETEASILDVEVEVVGPNNEPTSVYLGEASEPSLQVGGELKGDVGDPIKIGVLKTPSGELIGQISSDKYRGMRWRVMIALAPTEPEEAAVDKASAGLWTVRLTATTGIKKRIECWIQRDEDPTHLGSGGRQSYFEADPELIKLSGPYGPDGHQFVKRFGTLNGLATAPRTTIVGGYVKATGEPARYSSASNTHSCQSEKPIDASAVTEISQFQPGIVASGTRSGSLAILSGTSTAAPQIARQEAVHLADPGIDKPDGEPMPTKDSTGAPLSTSALTKVKDRLGMTRLKRQRSTGI